MSNVRVITAETALKLLGQLGLIVCSFVAFRYSSQPILEAHSFRQTQTALTSLWMVLNGYSFPYQTPVGGAPWVIPFEFPLYQLLVSLLHESSGINIDQCGRLLSFSFLILTAPVVSQLIRLLGFPREVFYIFLCIFLSSPIYIFWGRSFLVETAALFFTIVALKYFLELFLAGISAGRLVFFVIAAMLAILQKSTTAGPVLAVLFIFLFFRFLEQLKHCSVRDLLLSRDNWALALAVALPVLVGAAWVIYTDSVKQAGAFGAQLTSAALSSWNWGSLNQRFSEELWREVVWGRVLEGNAAGLFGAIIITAGFLMTEDRKWRVAMYGAAVLFLLPLLMFSNLHIVHDYYQSSVVVFLAFLISLCISAIARACSRPWLAAILVVVVMFFNYRSFANGYFNKVKLDFGVDSRDVAISSVLSKELRPEQQFVAFGNDWSSTFSYLSRRKSFTVPEWFPSYDAVKADPAGFVDADRLGAVLRCDGARYQPADLLQFAREQQWKIGATHGCVIATPEIPRPKTLDNPVPCDGEAAVNKLTESTGQEIFGLTGWVRSGEVSSKRNIRVYLQVLFSDATTREYQALRIPLITREGGRIRENESAIGFSRIIVAPSGSVIKDVRFRLYGSGATYLCNRPRHI